MARDSLGFKTWRLGRFDSPSCAGDRMKPIYTAKLEEDGTLSLTQTGEEDLYDYIQSHAQSVDINMIMKRYENGETDILQKVQGFYFDTSEVPDNMAELLNKLNYAEAQFNNMPVEFKEKYGNDFARFLCTFDPSAFVSDIVVSEQPTIKEEGNDEPKQ